MNAHRPSLPSPIWPPGRSSLSSVAVKCKMRHCFICDCPAEDRMKESMAQSFQYGTSLNNLDKIITVCRPSDVAFTTNLWDYFTVLLLTISLNLRLIILSFVTTERTYLLGRDRESIMACKKTVVSWPDVCVDRVEASFKRNS